jgi:hypothetical protein
MYYKVENPASIFTIIFAFQSNVCCHNLGSKLDANFEPFLY